MMFIRKKRILAMLLAGCLLFGFTGPALAAELASPPLRIAAVSDLYISMHSVTDQQGKLLSKSRALLDELIQTLLSGNVDAVVIAGNLTWDGERASHEYVKSRLYQLLYQDIPVYVIPGENDVAESGVNENAVTKEQFAEIYADFGYRDARAHEGLSYVAEPRQGYSLLMLDSIAEAGFDRALSGTGAINLPWAKAQMDWAMGTGQAMLGVSHHPSISRGSFEGGLSHWLSALADTKDANGSLIYTGDPFEGIFLNDKSAFPIEDMRELAKAGLTTMLTGHAGMMDEQVGLAQDGQLETTWTEYGIGSMAAASAGIRYLTWQPDGSVQSEVEQITECGGEPLYPMALAALEAYAPALLEEWFELARPVILRSFDIYKAIALIGLDALQFPESLPSVFGTPLKLSMKNTTENIFGLLQNPSNVLPVLDELKSGLYRTNWYGESTFHVLGGLLFQIQSGHSPFGPGLQLLLHQLRQGDGEAMGKVLGFMAEQNGMPKLTELINQILDQKLIFTSISRTVRGLLTGPITYLVITIDFWAILDDNVTVKPDGTPIPPEEKPSILYRPLVNETLLMETEPTTTVLTQDRLRMGLIQNAPQIGKLVLAPIFQSDRQNSES